MVEILYIKNLINNIILIICKKTVKHPADIMIWGCLSCYALDEYISVKRW